MNYRNLVLVLSAITALCSCNNDVFVDSGSNLQDINIEIAGDYGEASFDILNKHLQRITIDFTPETYLTYYDTGGNVCTDDVSAANLGRIEYTSEWVNFQILKDNSILTFKTFGNSSGTIHHIMVRLEYSYGAQVIYLDIEDGAPAELSSIEYGTISSGEYFTKEYNILYTNNTETTATFEVCPFLEYSETYSVEPMEDWARYFNVSMRLPMYDDGIWKYTEEQDVQLNVTGYLPLYYTGKMIPVEIPAGKSVRIISNVKYEQGTSTGLMKFRNPITDNVFPTVYKTITSTPVSYDFRVVQTD